MKYIYSLFFAFCLQILSFGQTSITYSVANNTWAITPVSSYFNETDSVTITFTVSTASEAIFNAGTSHALYLWAWSTDSAGKNEDCPTNGTWGASNATNKLTYVGTSGSNSTYTYTMSTAKSFYGNRANPLSKVSFLVKAANPSSKAQQSQDITLEVGRFQFSTENPTNGSINFVASGTSIPIEYKTSLPALFEVLVNGTSVHKTTSYSDTLSTSYTVTADSYIKVIATPQDTTYPTKTINFTENLIFSVQSASIPNGIRQGINYDASDPTVAYLAVYAPYKQYIHVIGDFDSDPYILKNKYLMNRDTTNTDLYWIKLTGLTPQKAYTFQYRTVATSTYGSYTVKVADPYSRLILSPDDDPYISATTYPNKPVYPSGQQFDVSVLQTDTPAYPWVVTNFTKPAKQNLIVYEALVRDFTAQQTWQSMIDKMPYIKSLNINAIELMPIMEFDGNNSWGYNTGFHYALDKAYGTPEKLKEFIDLCHQNGIAVILDVVLNHATGRSPIQRLWANNTTDGGYGAVSENNPYFNVVAKHSHHVFYDLNHSNPNTKYYVSRVLEQWINEYKIDGFRWDLTKGFTQACTSGDDPCTNRYQQDRVDIMKVYADTQWSHDPNSIAIFEHLGTDDEEKQWADYRVSEGKGVILWDKQTEKYNENTMGYGGANSNFNRVNHNAHTFSERRAQSYGESHDEERLMYKNLSYGASNGTYNVKDLATALNRQKAFGAVFLTIPGPKMIWQFGELGYDKSIFTCTDGTVNTSDDNCKLSPKQSAFAMGYDQDPLRKDIYDTWAKILQIRLSNQVFDTNTFTVASGNLMPRISIWNDTLPTTSLKNVVILANFTLVTQNITPDFPYTGTWYNLMDNSTFVVSNTSTPISIAPGEFRIFGNSSASLDTSETSNSKNGLSLKILNNPALNGEVKIRYTNARNGAINIFDMTGKVVQTYKVSQDFGDQTLFGAKLPAGMYLVQLKTDKTSVVEKLIIK